MYVKKMSSMTKIFHNFSFGDEKSTIKAGKGDELLNFQGLEF